LYDRDQKHYTQPFVYDCPTPHHTAVVVPR